LTALMLESVDPQLRPALLVFTAERIEGLIAAGIKRS
jgi:hypothetical protein